MARSMAAEMHSSFAALRREHSMNIRQIYDAVPPSEAVTQDIARIMQLWAQARARYGGEGDFLFGAFGAVEIGRAHSELQSLMRTSYAVFCLKKTNNQCDH